LTAAVGSTLPSLVPSLCITGSRSSMNFNYGSRPFTFTGPLGDIVVPDNTFMYLGTNLAPEQGWYSDGKETLKEINRRVSTRVKAVQALGPQIAAGGEHSAHTRAWIAFTLAFSLPVCVVVCVIFTVNLFSLNVHRLPCLDIMALHASMLSVCMCTTLRASCTQVVVQATRNPHETVQLLSTAANGAANERHCAVLQ
jgi:hypothetical protein